MRSVETERSAGGWSHTCSDVTCCDAMPMTGLGASVCPWLTYRWWLCGGESMLWHDLSFLTVLLHCSLTCWALGQASLADKDNAVHKVMGRLGRFDGLSHACLGYSGCSSRSMLDSHEVVLWQPVQFLCCLWFVMQNFALVAGTLSVKNSQTMWNVFSLFGLLILCAVSKSWLF